MFPTKYVIPKSLKVGHWLSDASFPCFSSYIFGTNQPQLPIYHLTGPKMFNFLGGELEDQGFNKTETKKNELKTKEPSFCKLQL